MAKSRKEKLEEIFYQKASPAERLTYDLKKEQRKVRELENLPVEIVEKEVVKEVVKEVENPIKGEEIVKLINKLELITPKQIDFQHIKGFPWHLTKGQSGGDIGFMGYGAYDLNIKAITLGQITANQNDYATGLGGWFRISSDAARSITGFENGTDGRGFLLTNVGGFAITLANQSASSAAINRILSETGADIVLASEDTAWVIYDITTERWRAILHSVGGSGTVTSVSVVAAAGVSGTVATATTTPAITITLGALTGVTSINGLIITANTGAITTGSWTATVIGANFGGTGITNNVASTLTISGSFATTITVSAITAVTLPTSGTLYGTAAASITSLQLLTSLSDETGTGAAVFATSPTLVTPLLGTPTSGVLTNCTGLPAASVLAGSFGAGAFVISTSLQVTTIELGHATDTTLSRVSAGLIAVEGVTVVDVSATQTLTNKTLTRPTFTNPLETTQTLTDGASIAWNMDSGGFATVTLAGNRTLANPTNLRNGATYVLIVKQDATGSRTLAYGTVYQWPGGTDPVLSTAASAVDIFTFVCDGTIMFGNILKAFAV